MTARRAKTQTKPTVADPLDGIGHGRIVVVADYSETFEIREDRKTLRKSPALYSKWFGAANDEPSACYMRRIDKLTRRPDGLLLEGGWGRILRAGSNHERTFRGFLTNDQSRPATVAQIAEQILFCDESTAADIVLGLLDVGLIRIEAEPDWAQRKAELDKQAEEARQAETEAASKGKTSRQNKPTTRRKNSVSRKNPDAPGNFRKQPPNITEPNDIADGKHKRSELNGNAKVGEDNASEPNATPLKPPKATLGGVSAPRASAPPRVSSGPGIVRLADALPRAVDGLAHGFALAADDFASEVFGLLQCPLDRESLDGRRELGCFREALLTAIDAGLSPSQIEEVTSKGKTDAHRIGRTRKRHYANGGTPERYWRFLWGRHVDARRGGLAKETA